MLWRILIPTISDEYRQSQDHYHSKFSAILEEKREYLKRLEDILERAERSKLQSLEQHKQTIRDDAHLINSVCDSIEKYNVLSAHRTEIVKNIEDYEHLLKCQTTLDMTGFYDLQDWAQATYEAYSGLANSLIALSLAGAAIVYATIFSAVRGNIGLMVFTFPLFSIGFIIPALVQTALAWANHRTAFASQTFWRITIGVFMAFASLCVAAAITILNFTVFELRKDSEALTDTIPRVAGIIAFTFSGLLVLLFVFSMTLSIIARGPKTVFLGETHMNRPTQKGWKLENFEHKGIRRKLS